MIAEQQVHLRAGVLIPVNGVEAVRQVGIQKAIAIACKKCPQGSTQHAFVSRHPLHAQLVRNPEDLG